MKLLILIFMVLIIVLFSSCSPDIVNPPEKPDYIPNLTITPDTLDFGTVPLGTYKDIVLWFENTGAERITISQSMSNKNFTFPRSDQNSFSIAPGTKQWITIRFTAADTVSQIAFDTVYSGDHKFILVLRTSWRYFSSLFPFGPKSFSLSLRGLIGVWDGGSYSNFDFTAYQPMESNGTVHFQGHGLLGGCKYASRNDINTYIDCIFDTVNNSIKWVRATYSENYEESGLPCPSHQGFSRNYAITAHDIPLLQNGTRWTAELHGIGLSSVIDTIEYKYTNSQQNNTTLRSVIGYDSTAMLSIRIE